MDIHMPNAYLEYLRTPEGQTHIGGMIYYRKIAPGTLPRDSIRWDPELGEYHQFTWKGGFDPAKEIVVSADRYCPNKTILYHSHDFFEIVYVYSGQCQTLVSGQPTLLHAGDICLYDLQAIHKLECFSPEDTVFNIVIRKDLFRRLLLELLTESDTVSTFFINSLYNRKSRNTCILLKAEDSYQCETYAQQIIETYYLDKPLSQNAMKAQLILLLLELSRQFRDDHAAEAGDLNLEDVITYISNHFRDVTLDSLAGYFGYSTRSMTRFLQKKTGFTFREIIQDVRFSHARSMLQETSFSTEEIAAQIGYEDRSCFEKAFKKYCYMTPASYRKQFFAG